MRKYYFSSLQIFEQIGNDLMLLAALFVPVAAGALIRFGIPALEWRLCAYFGKAAVIGPYFMMFDLFLSMAAPMMLSFSFAMIILEETDESVARYYLVTPLGKGGYLFSRTGIPVILSLTLTPLLLALFGIGGIRGMILVPVAVLGSGTAAVIALMIVSLSANKLEGMAVTKLSSLLTLGMMPPFFVSGRSGYLFAVFPSFWLAKYAMNPGVAVFLCGFAVNVVWIGVLVRVFYRKVSV